MRKWDSLFCRSRGGGEKLKIIGGKLMEGKDRDYVQ